MPCSGVLRPVAPVRIDVSEERNASIIVVTVFLHVVPRSPILYTLMMEMFLRNVGSYRSHTA
jgi:hypothetical protein